MVPDMVASREARVRLLHLVVRKGWVVHGEVGIISISVSMVGHKGGMGVVVREVRGCVWGGVLDVLHDLRVEGHVVVGLEREGVHMGDGGA